MTAPAQMSAQPLGTGRETLSPGEDWETDCIDCESQRNSSRKLSPLSLTGARVEIWARMSKSDPSTPTVKKANDLAPSPCLTCWAAAFHSSVGPPSVMRNTQGR